MVSKVSIEKRDEEYRASLEEFARKFDELLDLDMSDRAACCESLLNLAKATNNRSIIRRAKNFIEEASNSDWEDATFKNKYTYLIDVNIRQTIISAEKAIYDRSRESNGDNKIGPVYFDGWTIMIKNRMFYSSLTGETIKLEPQQGKVFANFITKKKDDTFYPVLTVAEIIDISATSSYDEKRVAWTIRNKINSALSQTKHYSHYATPIDNAGLGGTGDDYAYILRKSEELKR